MEARQRDATSLREPTTPRAMLPHAPHRIHDQPCRCRRTRRNTMVERLSRPWLHHCTWRGEQQRSHCQWHWHSPHRAHTLALRHRPPTTTPLTPHDTLAAVESAVCIDGDGRRRPYECWRGGGTNAPRLLRLRQHMSLALSRRLPAVAPHVARRLHRVHALRLAHQPLWLCSRQMMSVLWLRHTTLQLLLATARMPVAKLSSARPRPRLRLLLTPPGWRS